MSEPDQDQDPLLGQLVSHRYRVLRKIGEGGMGTVYEAEHIAIEKRIALKVLRREFSSSPTVVARFKQEAISASRIKHQNVIDVFDFGQLDDGACYIAMEYLEGHDLGDLLHQGKVFWPPRAVAIAVAVCRALALSHTRGVVHRDLKPENIFLQRTPEGDECVKLVDFGIAQLRKPDEPEPTDKRRRRLTKTGMIFGTPEYMAPEQARGQMVDERSDIYAMGVILYELISGAVPFVGDTVLEVLNAHNTRAVPPLETVNTKVSISPELWRVIARALEKEPDDRFASMGDFCDALLRCPEGSGLGPEPVLPRAPDPAPSDDPVRIENSSYPAAGPGKDTAVFGSPAQERELEAALPLAWHVPRWVGAALGLALLAGGGAWMWNRVSHGGGVSPEAATGPAPSADLPAQAPPSAPHAARVRAEHGSAEKDEPGTNAADTGVPQGEPAGAALDARSVLHVSSEPPGAVIELDGFQVCDSAPCEVVVKAGQAVVLTAHKGPARAETKVLAQRSQTVTMVLESPKKPAGKRPAVSPPPRASPGGALCEVLVDGIKILRPCE